jgi:hypothetical protein
MTDDGFRELAHRASDGIEVTLAWRKSDNRVTVSVSDSKTGEAFEVAVEQTDQALHAFEHPFAYAALRRIHRAARADRETLTTASSRSDG